MVREACGPDAVDPELRQRIALTLEEGQTIDDWIAKYLVNDDDQPTIVKESWADELLLLGLGLLFNVQVGGEFV